MKVQTGWRKAGVVRRAVVLGLCFALFSLQPTLGGAAVVTQTFTTTSLSFAAPVADIFDYTGGTATVWSDAADFAGGSFSATNADDVPGSIVLDRIGPSGVIAPDPAIPWWDTDWTNRRCFAVDHTAAGANNVDQYQLRVPFPIEQLVGDGFVQADLGDLRAIGSDAATSLPLWVDDTEPDTVWLQMDSITAGDSTTACIYYGHAPGPAVSPANHTEAAVFTHTSLKRVYYAVADLYDSATTPINVVSYVPGNQVARDDGTVLSLAAAGDLDSFDAAGNTAGSWFATLGPISASGVGDGADSLVPISFAGTVFTAPISRDAQQFSFIAPFADAVVTLFDGATEVATFPVLAGTPYTHVADDISAGNTAVIASDVPVLVAHRSDIGGDAVALYPATSGSFPVVRSGEVLLGFESDGASVAVAGSDGATSTTGGDRGDAVGLSGGIAQGGGPADGLLITSENPIGVVMHEDGDGTESVAALPARELSSSYWIPTGSEYIAFACPTDAGADIGITVSPPGAAARPVTCSGGPEVAWASDTADLATTTQGIRVSADDGSVFAAYYEDQASDDQVGLLGMKQGRQYTWPEPVVTPGGDEGLYETSGTWESATADIGPGSAVYGLIAVAGDVPAATTLQIQVATAPSGTPSDFVGPDGTASSYFTPSSLPAVLDFGHDGDRLLRVRAELLTTNPVAATPRLGSVSVEGHLPRLTRALGSTPPFELTGVIDPAVASSYLLRVKTTNATITGSEATVVYRGGTNLTNLIEETVRLVNDATGVDSVQQSTTRPADPPTLFQSDRPHSVVFDHSAAGPGTTTLEFTWRLDYAGEGSIFLETDFAVEVAAP